MNPKEMCEVLKQAALGNAKRLLYGEIEVRPLIDGDIRAAEHFRGLYMWWDIRGVTHYSVCVLDVKSSTKTVYTVDIKDLRE